MTRNQPFRPTATLLAALFTAVATLASVGCGEKVPVQPVQFNGGRLNMAISQDWTLQRDTGKEAYYTHALVDGVRLSFEDETENYGVPMNVQGVRSAIGTELNRIHGGVEARLGLGGCAVLTYRKKVRGGSGKLYTHNWVVAHPLGYGAVNRVAITLSIPDGQQTNPAFLSIIDLLDKQVGDASMPEA